MSIPMPSGVFKFPGQVVSKVAYGAPSNQLIFTCLRDRRRKVFDPETGQSGTINRYVRRRIKDIPLLGCYSIIEIELAEIRLANGIRRIEEVCFVEKGCYYTKRFCKLMSGLCRHMTIQSIAKHFHLRWETVKNIDKIYLQTTLPSLDPSQLSNLKYIGVDEVARAKGHDYMTVVYDMVSGQLIWVEAGRTSDVFSMFLRQLSPECASNIEAVAMDMGLAYQKSVRDYLPNADIVFDRFHVMKNFSKAIDNQRRIEFRKADNEGKKLMKGCRFLLLKNREKLKEKQEEKLKTLLNANKNLSTMYVLKEQLQALWSHNNYEEMHAALEAWCLIADASNMLYMKKFVKSARNNKVGICNYAKHSLTSARIEAGNVGIGLLRKRARGIQDTEYFKLKIRQLGTAENGSIFYNSPS
tara:strand:- start:31 stop:1266 length:1236 start_codon:yes stop_codon:yes gene_type:complete